MRRVYHVTKTEGGWQGKQEGSMSPVVRGETKRDVVTRTIEIAKQQPLSSVRIHRANGTIEEERTYPRSSDPRSHG